MERLDLEIRPGVTAVLGPNGAGKSTLLGLLSTGLTVQCGQIRLDELDSRRDTTRYRAALGFLPQTFTLPTNLTVAEFLTLTAWHRLVPRAERALAVRAALEAVDLLDRADTKISRLSGGMHRRVGIAQAIVNQPRLLVLDEPTVGLDPRHRRELRTLVRTLSTDRAVVVSTHLTEDVAAIADDVVVLDEGTLLFAGSLTELTGGGIEAADIDAAYDALTMGEVRR
nr:ABC transporter ATP-binding protein [Streptoalloteichus tenebrarius]